MPSGPVRVNGSTFIQVILAETSHFPLVECGVDRLGFTDVGVSLALGYHEFAEPEWIKPRCGRLLTLPFLPL
ncbi:hypothetical protein GA0070612_2908 [Micromonospora chokoriensis]|uniref:Uncharacterized protein n=1 Tax=Micromonospora chokoriensis TaxID=356851 RepID=A0A1C4WVW9_9ACTN|nr:hypothetical protein GA0070612_2908 [Micromonospora chokoriensis]